MRELVKEGDTDREYFAKYTPAQLAWRDSGRAEELSYLVMGYGIPTRD